MSVFVFFTYYFFYYFLKYGDFVFFIKYTLFVFSPPVFFKKLKYFPLALFYLLCTKSNRSLRTVDRLLLRRCFITSDILYDFA